MSDINIIHEPAAKSLLRKISELSITAFAWSIWLYLLLPIVSLFLWYTEGYILYEHIFNANDYKILLSMSNDIYIAIIGSFIVIRGWAYYNYFRFSKRERRKSGMHAEEEEQLLSEFHNISRSLLRQLRGNVEVVWKAGMTTVIQATPWLEEKRHNITAAKGHAETGKHGMHLELVHFHEIHPKTEPSITKATFVTLAMIYAVAGMIVFTLWNMQDYDSVESRSRTAVIHHEPHNEPGDYQAAAQNLVTVIRKIPDYVRVAKNIADDYVYILLPNDQQILAVVESWRKAWSAQDITSYLDYYADDFHTSPRFPSIQRWKAYKKRVISGSKFIKVKLINIQVKFNQEENIANVTFEQIFTNGRINDRDEKILVMKKYRGVWKITSESVMNKAEKGNETPQNDPKILDAGQAPRPLKQPKKLPDGKNVSVIVAPEAIQSVAKADAPGKADISVENDGVASAEKLVPQVGTGGSDTIQKILSAVESWRKAWGAQDITSYLRHYADDFHTSPKFSSIQRWKAYKKRVISGSKFIKVKLTNIQIKLDQEGNKADVTFDQFFTNGKITDKDAKILMMKKYNGSWKIISESVVN